MDALFRLRVLIWLLVLGLWGVMVYQFLGEEELERPQVAYVANPYRGRPPAPPQVLPPAAPPETGPAASPPSSLEFIKPLPIAAPRRPPRHPAPMRRERPWQRQQAPIPPGFVKTVTRHFLVYSEKDPVSSDFVALLENLHGNLMLDLAAFSPWASQQRVTIFLFKNQDTYRRVTGRPAWSGGATTVRDRKVYVYESDELPGILAHELTHVYYDGFFLHGTHDPLWLSEGMATLVQVERGLATPEWLRENLDILERGGGFTLPQLMSVTSTANSPDDKVRLWYAESYSVVRFLIRAQSKNDFYKFSEYLREGKSTTQALYRAYGMPYNRIKALEYAWRYDLTSSSLTRLSPQAALGP
ncbi:MAG: hypothetical protein KGK30_09160 [Elusimicrobia bacterium]|nr:hypothetical protein [Elusimicrobiota bacterium]